MEVFMIPASKLDNLRDSVKAVLKGYSLENGRKEVEDVQRIDVENFYDANDNLVDGSNLEDCKAGSFSAQCRIKEPDVNGNGEMSYSGHCEGEFKVESYNLDNKTFKTTITRAFEQ